MFVLGTIDRFARGMKKLFILLFAVMGAFLWGGCVSAASCADVEFVFARGSGGVYQENVEYQTFKRVMTKMADRIGMASYRFTDVDYPAVSVSDPITNALGAYISAGKYYKFGRSVNAGVSWLRDYYTQTMQSCPTTRWVLAGYSQGAMVVAQAAQRFRADRIIYIGLVADPQLNLPEGRGLLPDACLGRNYSEYRVFVPNCRTHTGRLGTRNPYQYGELVGKYGLWCGKNDYVCGSTASPLNNSGHTQYVEAGSYLQMSYLVFQRMTTSRVELQSMRTVAAESEIYAMLAQDEYYARPGDEVEISAESSFSFGADIVRYEWAVDDGDYLLGEAVWRQQFALGTHEVKLRITNSAGAQSEATASVVIAESFDGYVLPAPEVLAERQADAVYFSWSTAPAEAKYLLVRLNGFDLACVGADEAVVGVHDLEINDDDVLSVAWADEDWNVGAEFVVKISAVTEVETLTHEQTLQPKDPEQEFFNAPQTGVDIDSFWALALAMICAVGVVVVLWH